MPFALEIIFSDGSTWRNREGRCRFSIRLRSRAVQSGIAASGHIGMLEG